MLRIAPNNNFAPSSAYVLLLMTKPCDYGALAWITLLYIIWGGSNFYGLRSS